METITDDGGPLAAITHADGIVMSAIQGYLARETVPGGAKPKAVAKLAYEIADEVIRVKKERANPQPQEPTQSSDA